MHGLGLERTLVDPAAYERTVSRFREMRVVMHKLRTFTSCYTHGLPLGSRLRGRISTLDTPDAFHEAIESFFEEHGIEAAA